MRTNFDILVFDLVGKIAHFRKFYANSSSLSYLFPPRTTLEGIVAGILGYDRDSYYDIFDPSECMITVSPMSRMRTIFQTVNYISVKSLNDLNGKLGRTQIPFELVVPENFGDHLRYRIYFAHSDDQMISRLEAYLRDGRSHYPISFGAANFLANAFYISRVHNASLSVPDKETLLKVQTPILASKNLIRSLLIDENRSSKFTTDIFPFHFNKGRTLGINRKLIYDKNFQPIFLLNQNTPFAEIKYVDGGAPLSESIVFLESLTED